MASKEIFAFSLLMQVILKGGSTPQPHESADNLHRLPFQYLWGGVCLFHTALMHTLFSGMP